MDDLLRDLDKADQDARKRRVDDQQETEARRALADAHDHLRYLKPQHVQEGWQEGERLPDAFWPKLADAIRKYVDGLSQTEHAKRLEELRDGGETDRRWAVAVYQLVQAGNIQDAEEHLRTRLSNDGDFDGNVYWRRRNWLVNRLPAELTGCQEEPESESETLDVAEQKLAAGGKVLTAAKTASGKRPKRSYVKQQDAERIAKDKFDALWRIDNKSYWARVIGCHRDTVRKLRAWHRAEKKRQGFKKIETRLRGIMDPAIMEALYSSDASALGNLSVEVRDWMDGLSDDRRDEVVATLEESWRDAVS